MAEKGLNLFGECTAECVYLFPSGRRVTSGIIAGSQKTPNEIKK